MTKKDYERFAQEIRDYTHGQDNAREFEALVNVCVRVFSADNGAFKSDKFREACETGKHIRKTIKGVC